MCSKQAFLANDIRIFHFFYTSHALHQTLAHVSKFLNIGVLAFFSDIGQDFGNALLPIFTKLTKIDLLNNQISSAIYWYPNIIE